MQTVETLIRQYEQKRKECDKLISRTDTQLSTIQKARLGETDPTYNELSKERALLHTQRRAYDYFVSDLYRLL